MAFRHILAGSQGLAVIAVDPRYTSSYEGASWKCVLSTSTRSRPAGLGNH